MVVRRLVSGWAAGLLAALLAVPGECRRPGAPPWFEPFPPAPVPATPDPGDAPQAPAVPKAGQRGRGKFLPVGWCDEMNDPATWKLRDGGQTPEFFAAQAGSLMLRLPHVPEGFPYEYQWGGVTRTARVDLGKYPVLVARLARVQPGGYCHLDVEQLDYSGNPVHTLTTPAMEYAGLMVRDLGKEYGPYTRRLVLRINTGGSLKGTEAEVAWVRFVRREDLAFFQKHPDWQSIELKP